MKILKSMGHFFSLVVKVVKVVTWIWKESEKTPMHAHLDLTGS